MNQTLALRIAAIFGFAAVALGAFGAHGLKNILQEHQTSGTWETAVFYHFIHALMLFLLPLRPPLRLFPWSCFAVGILIFSGSLYLLALTNLRWLGAITPLGGVSFLIGWGCLVLKPPTS